jgi:hypothetical protein
MMRLCWDMECWDMDSQWLVELYGPTSYKPVQEDGQGKGQKVGHERKEIVPTSWISTCGWCVVDVTE